MTHRAGRVICAQCGSNNFENVLICWKCSAPLGARPAAKATSPPPIPVSPGGSSDSPPPTAPALSGTALTPPAPADSRPVHGGNLSTANWAAFWLGILMPYFGAPIGLAFMMCDDTRRQEVGRWCLLWSVVGFVVHGLVSAMILIGMREYLQIVLKSVTSAAERSMGGAPLFTL